MQKISPKPFVKSRLTQGILSTLAFFDIYNLPISSHRVFELLYRAHANEKEVQLELDRLVTLGIIIHKEKKYALTDWDEKAYQANQVEIGKRWTRIRKYYWLLSIIPFIQHVSVINSVAMGNADSESDIDFFVIARPNLLYFVRTAIIVLFKMLGVYKNKDHVNMRFCFGFYITSDNLAIKSLLLPNEDPYLVFWLATIMPIYSLNYYEKFIKENKWIYSWFPNFKTLYRLEMYRKFKTREGVKKILEIIFAIPATILEPLLRRIHINHTFNLPENHWKTSSTIANRAMLKLHALDPRKDLRRQFYEILQRYN